MIHGVYIKNKPKSRWQLFSMTTSPELATLELTKAKETATLGGYDQAEVGIQIYETYNNIPEYLKDLKNHKILFN